MLDERLSNKISNIDIKIDHSALSKTLILLLKQELDSSLSKEFQDHFSNKVTPCFEKYLKTMFSQINDTFERGLKYYQDKITED